MIDIKSRFDVSILDQAQLRSDDGEGEFVQVTVHDGPIPAFYVHFALIECFENIDSYIAPYIVTQAHYHGKAILPPGKYDIKEAEKALEKVKELNKKSGENLVFTMEQI